MTERSNGSAHEEPDDAPEGFREQPRYAPTVERMYANDAETSLKPTVKELDHLLWQPR